MESSLKDLYNQTVVAVKDDNFENVPGGVGAGELAGSTGVTLSVRGCVVAGFEGEMALRHVSLALRIRYGFWSLPVVREGVGECACCLVRLPACSALWPFRWVVACGWPSCEDVKRLIDNSNAYDRAGAERGGRGRVEKVRGSPYSSWGGVRESIGLPHIVVRSHRYSYLQRVKHGNVRGWSSRMNLMMQRSMVGR